MQFFKRDLNYRRTSRASVHRDLIILALKKLGKARTGLITKWINERAKGQKLISKRGVQFILPKLFAQGLVTKNEYNEYSLTKAGGKEPIFGELYGKMLFEGLTSIPLTGTTEEKMLECVKRLGFYITYIFLQNSVHFFGKWEKALVKNDGDWTNEAIDPSFMFKWFAEEFHRKEGSSRSSTIFELPELLVKHFNQYYSKIVESEIKFGQKIP